MKKLRKNSKKKAAVVLYSEGTTNGKAFLCC